MGCLGVGGRVSDVVWFSRGEWSPAVSNVRHSRPLSHEFTIPGEPLSKARPRVTARGHAYTPKTTQMAEERVREAFVASGGVMMPGTLGLSVVFRPGTRVRRDLDNQLKLVMDALNGLAYADDFQIAFIQAKRVFVTKAEACTEVRVFQL